MITHEALSGGRAVGASQLARTLWQSGLRVFPLHPFLASGDKARCLCGWNECPAPGKHPLAASWQHTPTWSDDQIDAMAFAGQLDSGYGVLCRGLLVVDIDARNGGLESFARLSQRIPEIAGAGMIVSTGSGGGSRHLYFTAPEGAALLHHLPDLPGIDFKSAGYVVGPGSRHASGGLYTLDHGSPDDVEPAPPALLALLARPERHRTEWDGRAVDVSHRDIAEMLTHISPDCTYDVWIRVGMAIHHATGGTGVAIWDAWSAGGAKYDARRIGSHWHSFGRSANPVTFGTLAHYAKEGGWTAPVEIVADQDENADHLGASGQKRPGLPFDVSGVDLLSPPGYVGEVAAWIEAQCLRPRRRLAVAGALTAIGNIAGLRYCDDTSGVTPNLFAFCVAGSRTGKEAIQQAVTQIHRAAGCAPATHGAIKSEQEIIKNLTRHQAAFYIIDEIGIFLQKIKNAQTRGGAIYLDGVIGILMSAYSKADGFLLISGDLKQELQNHLLRELSTLNRKLDEGSRDDAFGLEARIAHTNQALGSIDNGLDRPFVSLIGFTTPTTFDDLVDFQSATNGFIGRALIFVERDTAPRSKPGFARQPMPPAMATTLAQIYSAGEYDMSAPQRVEYYGERAQVPTDKAAAEMLLAARDWFEDQAIAHKSLTGLEALYLGAYELVAKVALILAIPEGRRTTEHVRWAFELIRADVDSKARLVTSNDRAKDAPKTALQAKLANLIEGEGETLGVIYNRCRKFSRQDVKTALDAMVEAGLAFCVMVPAEYRRKETTLYRLSSDK